MEESQASAAAAGTGGPPLSIEVNKTALTTRSTPGTTCAHPALLPLASSGQSTPTTIGTGSLLTATTTTAVGATAAADACDSSMMLTMPMIGNAMQRFQSADSEC